MGKGNASGSLFLVGEAPGEAEAEHGLPFRGRSGQLLGRVLRALRIEDDCYITNAAKCRPPDNRDPTEAEVGECHRFLLGELEIVRPRVIVMLGVVARNAFGFGKRTPRGRPILRDGLKYVYTYHPAYCLRSGDAGERELTRQLRVAKGAMP